MAEEADNPTTEPEHPALNDALAHCLEKLNSEDRQLLSKRYEDAHPITAIAQQMKRNAATVRVRLYRIRQGLKRCMESILSQGGAA